MQAIVTKYLGLTSTKMPRIKAISQAGHSTIYWDDNLDVEKNHEYAAIIHAHKHGWILGASRSTPRGDMVKMFREQFACGSMPGVYVSYAYVPCLKSYNT